MKYILILLTPFLWSCQTNPPRIFGVTMVAPPEKSAANPLMPARDMGFGWMAIVPYGFVRKDSCDVKYTEVAHRIMWGERPEGIRESVQWARAAGMKVMLKPQVWSGRTWIGNLAFADETQWQRFEKTYADYIKFMAGIAQESGVEMLCIGTELNEQLLQRQTYWKELIEDIRRIYSGKITYSANWDNWERFPYWADMDYIGLGSYFPLSEQESPHADTLVAAWGPIATRLELLSERYNKQILFTEMGYLAVPGCCGKLWELEPRRKELPADPECQARAFECLLQVFTPKKWWAGGFVWKYYPQTVMSPSHGEKDYDIQGKPVEKVFKSRIKSSDGNGH